MRIITLLLALSLTLVACKQKATEKNMTMNKNTFWQLIEEAKKKSRTNLDARYEIMVSMLEKYPPEEIVKFGQIAGVYVYAANENLALWAACKAIEGYASDDTFLYFCCWLVSQGREVYTDAAKDPDSLADTDVEQYDDENYGHSFEMLMAVSHEAYERKTGVSLYEMDTDPEAESQAALSEEQTAELLDGITFVDDTPFRESEEVAKRQIAKRLPKLTRMFGYDAEADLAELEAIKADPEAALAQLRQQLIASGVDVESIPELASQPPMPASAAKYDEVWRYTNGLAAVRKGEKWGYLNPDGVEVIPVQYDMGANFVDDIMPMMLNGKWGYVNKQGKAITPAKYDVASLFYAKNKQYAWVEVGGKKGFIDRKGVEVVPLKYDELNFGITNIKGRIGDKWEVVMSAE